MQKKNITKKALLVGSVVYDALFDLTTPINDQIRIVDGKPGWQNLMFAAKSKQVYFGGPAGNIAYGLSLLKQKSILASVAGKDFVEYAAHLRHLSIDSRVVIIPQGHTATFYGMTDTNKQQMGVFQPNSYHAELPKFPVSKLVKKNDWKNISVGIFSPGTAASIIRDMKEFKMCAPKNAIAIFDPGQMLAIDFTKKTFTEAVRHADMLIINETEAHFFKTKFNFSLEQLWKLGLKQCIVTLGSEGSVLHTPTDRVAIKAYKAKNVIDPTGAGDAYRAGLIHGILQGKSFPDAMDIGARLGAQCVACKGGQTYKV